MKLLSRVLFNGGVKGNPVCAICGGEKDRNENTCPNCSKKDWLIRHYLLAEERCSGGKADADEGEIKRVSEFEPVLANILLIGGTKYCSAKNGIMSYYRLRIKEFGDVKLSGYINCCVFGNGGDPSGKMVTGLVELRRKLVDAGFIRYFRVEMVYPGIISDVDFQIKEFQNSMGFDKQLPNLDVESYINNKNLVYSVGFVPNE